MANFKLVLAVYEKPSTFRAISIGDCFTTLTDVESWEEFPVYIKVDDSIAFRIETGMAKRFLADQEIRLVRYREVEKPED